MQRIWKCNGNELSVHMADIGNKTRNRSEPLKKGAEETTGQSHESAYKVTHVQRARLMKGRDSENQDKEDKEEERKGHILVAMIA